jgi:hypothetical protein
MMQRREIRAMGLALISLALVPSANNEEKKAGCNFDAYRPLKIGTLIRGGHESLALEKANPVYPREALIEGIGGLVIVRARLRQRRTRQWKYPRLDKSRG